MAVTLANQCEGSLNIGFVVDQYLYAARRRTERLQRGNGLALGSECRQVCADGDDFKCGLILRSQFLDGATTPQLAVRHDGGAVAEGFDIREDMR